MFVGISATTVCVLMFFELHYLEDSAFTKGLLSLFFNLYFALKNPINMLIEFCQDIHSELGDIDPVHSIIHPKFSDSFLMFQWLDCFACDQDVEVDKQCHFAIINMKTATTAAVSVCRSSGNSILLSSIIHFSPCAAAVDHLPSWQSARWGGLAYCQKEKPNNSW